jgi:hypothetical protein
MDQDHLGQALGREWRAVEKSLFMDIRQRPIIICCNVRTGSTALADMLGNLYDIEIFSEPLLRRLIHDPTTAAPEIPELEAYKSVTINRWIDEFVRPGKNDYVLKFIAGDCLHYDIYKQLLLGEGYKIRLYRRNKCDQIVSYYIANTLDIWHQGNMENLKQVETQLTKELNRIVQNMVPGAPYITKESEFDAYLDFLRNNTADRDMFEIRVVRVRHKFKQMDLHHSYRNAGLVSQSNIHINTDMIHFWTDEVARQDKILKDIDAVFDVNLAYEDLGMLTNTIFDKNQNPKNIEEIRIAVAQHLVLRKDLESSWML